MKTGKIILELGLDEENIEVLASKSKLDFIVYHSVINHAIEILKSELHEISDLEKVSYFEGVFNAISSYAETGNLDEQLFSTYLAEFIRESGIQRITLERVNFQVLAALEKML